MSYPQISQITQITIKLRQETIAIPTLFSDLTAFWF